MRICDVTQFYSPVSGGVKRYVHEKIAFLQKHSPGDEHLLIVPGERDEVNAGEGSRVYSIRSPLISRTSRYRALFDLRAFAEIINRESPDIIESSDPYQVGWKAISLGRALRVPVIGYYHSHFAEAYVRSGTKFLGSWGSRQAMKLARQYVKKLYNSFAATLVPSEPLAEVLHEWGVSNTRILPLGVNTETFTPLPNDSDSTRRTLGIPADKRLLLYVGRLASEKNTRRLFDAFALLQRRRPGEFHLLVVGDGPERAELMELKRRSANVSWIQYATHSEDLARYYRAADLFVHPGVQETFGLVALESQACGTPVTGITGSNMDRIILHSQSNWAAADTIEALADTMEVSAPQKVSGFGGEGASGVAQRYSWTTVFEQLLCIYREVCANYRQS